MDISEAESEIMEVGHEEPTATFKRVSKKTKKVVKHIDEDPETKKKRKRTVAKRTEKAVVTKKK